MKRGNRLTAYALLAFVLIAGMTFAENDAAGCKDHPLLTWMPNFYIQDCYKKDFGQMGFVNAKGEDIKVDGERYHISYCMNSGAQKRSSRHWC